MRPLLWTGSRRRRRRRWPRCVAVALLFTLALRQVSLGVAEVRGRPLPPPLTRAQVELVATRAWSYLRAGWATVYMAAGQVRLALRK